MDIFEILVGEDLDFKFDFAPIRNKANYGCAPLVPRGECDALGENETIVSFIINNPDNAEIHTEQLSDFNSAVVFWVRNASLGQEYRIECEATTNNSPARTMKDTMIIRCI